MPPECRDVQSVLILKADRFYLRAMRAVVETIYPHAQIRAWRVAEGGAALRAASVDVLLTGVCLPDGDVIDRLAEWAQAPRRAHRVLVVTARHEPRLLAVLRRLPIQGIFDPSMDEPENFSCAVRETAAGRHYWSQDRVAAAAARYPLGCEPIVALTPSEQMVFGVIGDGCDDATAARELDMKESSVRSVRQQLHRKLRVQHKGGLVRLAAQHGYVCMGAYGVTRPGLSDLRRTRLLREARRGGREGTPAPNYNG